VAWICEAIAITLPSKEDAISILRSKESLFGARQDQTIKQHKFLNDLRSRLKEYHNAGVNKTIRFFDGVPRIVDRSVSSQLKN